MEEKKLNKIGEVLRDQGRTNQWLADRLGKDKVTVSRWCRNVQQPTLETLFQIADLLGVSVHDLLEEYYRPEEDAEE